MTKLLLLLILGAGFAYLSGRILRSSRNQAKATSHRAAEQMVACWCGVNIPASMVHRDAAGRPACCEEHALARRE